MSRFPAAAASAAVVAVVAAFVWTAVPGAPGAGAQDLQITVPWQTDLDAARKQAKEEGRPLLVVFR